MTARSPIAAPRPEQLPDAQLARVVSSLTQSVKQLQACPITTGVATEAVAFATGVAVDVPHKLGRAFVGAFPLLGSAPAVLSLAASQRDPAKFISVVPAANATARLWVF